MSSALADMINGESSDCDSPIDDFDHDPPPRALSPIDMDNIGLDLMPESPKICNKKACNKKAMTQNCVLMGMVKKVKKKIENEKRSIYDGRSRSQKPATLTTCFKYEDRQAGYLSSSKIEQKRLENEFRQEVVDNILALKDIVDELNPMQEELREIAIQHFELDYNTYESSRGLYVAINPAIELIGAAYICKRNQLERMSGEVIDI